MTLRRAGAMLLLLAAWGTATAAQVADPVANERWSKHPSVYIFASADESTDVAAVDGVEVGEASPAADVALSLDVQRQNPRGPLRAALFGVARNPVSNQDRSFFVAGRLQGTRSLSPHWTLTFDDSAKLQRRPRLSLVGFQRNDATAGFRWRSAAGLGISLEAGDTRRILPELEALGFSRQAGSVVVSFPLTAHSAAEVSASLQRYRATTVTGSRAVVSGEVATFGGPMLGSLRYAWFPPINTRQRLPDVTQPGGGSSEFQGIDAAEFFEQLAYAGSDAAVLSESFFLDSLEADSDEWDFGRQKHVLTAFGSRRLGARASLSGFVRGQHRRGPNLLVPGDLTSFADDRLLMRATFRYPVSNRVTLLVQGSYLRNWSDRRSFDFGRSLVTAGFQLHY